MEGGSLYTAPASAVLVEGTAWHFGIDGRPYYAIWAKPFGRQKSGRHLIKCGLAHSIRVTISWTASDGALSHDGILRKMREWSSLHADGGRLRCVAALEEKPDEPDGEVHGAADGKLGKLDIDEPDYPDAKPDEPDAGEISCHPTQYTRHYTRYYTRHYTRH